MRFFFCCGVGFMRLYCNRFQKGFFVVSFSGCTRCLYGLEFIVLGLLGLGVEGFAFIHTVSNWGLRVLYRPCELQRFGFGAKGLGL